MPLQLLILLLLCNFTISAQQFFYNKTTKQYNSKTYIDSTINNCNAAYTKEYPYFLKTENKTDSLVTTWVTWPMAKWVSNKKQAAFLNLLYNQNIIAVNGKIINRHTLKNKIIVLNFWADFCQPCIDEILLLNTIANDFEKDTNIIFLSPCLNAQNNCKTLALKNNFAFSTFTNTPAIKLMQFLKVNWYPTTIIINKKGVITHYLNQTGNSKRYPIIATDTYYLTILHTLQALQNQF